MTTKCLLCDKAEGGQVKQMTFQHKEGWSLSFPAHVACVVLVREAGVKF